MTRKLFRTVLIVLLAATTAASVAGTAAAQPAAPPGASTRADRWNLYRWTCPATSGRGTSWRPFPPGSTRSACATPRRATPQPRSGRAGVQHLQRTLRCHDPHRGACARRRPRDQRSAPGQLPLPVRLPALPRRDELRDCRARPRLHLGAGGLARPQHRLPAFPLPPQPPGASAPGSRCAPWSEQDRSTTMGFSGNPHLGALAFGSGKKNLERSMVKRPGYPEYMQRTSGFVPLPPKKSPAGPAAKQPDPADVSILKRFTKETP